MSNYTNSTNNSSNLPLNTTNVDNSSSVSFSNSTVPGAVNVRQHQQQFVLQRLKRRAVKVTVPLDERVTLERALGFTVNTNARFAQSCDGLIAYLAGCVIVLYNSERQTQEFITSSARKTLTCVAFSHDGRSIATGEVNLTLFE
jgi:hypothetical protein